MGSEMCIRDSSLTVVPNPLDSHDSIRLVRQGDRRILVVGPASGAPENAALLFALRPIFEEAAVSYSHLTLPTSDLV